jgi:hypothetical protein
MELIGKAYIILDKALSGVQDGVVIIRGIVGIILLEVKRTSTPA